MNSFLESAIRHARTQPLTPRATPPEWMDFNRVLQGFKFFERHNEFILNIMVTSGLGSIFAGNDITPIMMYTEGLPYQFSERLDLVMEYMNVIMAPRDSLDDFVATNLGRACKLGMIHVGIGKRVAVGMDWDKDERVPLNQQSYCLVLFGFSWWPIEALAASGQIHPEELDEELEGWFHLWAVIGYAMGLAEELLPTDYFSAKQTAALIKEAQYTTAGEKTPEGIPILLGGQIRWMVEKASLTPNVGDLAPAQILLSAAGAFREALTFSPGLSEALALGSYPAGRLIKYAMAPAPRAGMESS